MGLLVFGHLSLSIFLKYFLIEFKVVNSLPCKSFHQIRNIKNHLTQQQLTFSLSSLVINISLLLHSVSVAVNSENVKCIIVEGN